MNDYSRIADIFDSVFWNAEDIPFWLNEVGATNGEVLEFNARTGRVSLPLLRARVALTCVEDHPELFAILQERIQAKQLSGKVLLSSVSSLRLAARYQLIIMHSSSFAEELEPADQLAVLRSAYLHLAAGGKFICALANPVVRLKDAKGHKRLLDKHPTTSHPGVVACWVQERLADGILESNYSLEEYGLNSVQISYRELSTRMFFPSAAEFSKMANSVGFTKPVVLGDYNYAPFQEALSPWMIWALTK